MRYDQSLEHDLVDAFVACADDLAGDACSEVVDAAVHFLAIATMARLKQKGLPREARRGVAKAVQRDVHSVVARALRGKPQPRLVPPEPPSAA